MRRPIPALVVALLVLSAGCTAGISAPPGGSAMPSLSGGSPTPSVGGTSTEPPAEDASPSSPSGEASTTSSRGGTPVEYFVRAGEVPAGFESVTVTLRVVFVDRPGDLGPCYPDVFAGPYKPTITPILTPSDDCHRSEPIGVDLAGTDGRRSLGTFTAPGSAGGHALIVTGITATRRNGTTVTAIKGTGGAELITSPDRPEGPYGVELGIGAARDGAGYDYLLLSERFEPAG